MQFLTQEQFRQKIRDGEAMGIPKATTYQALKDKGYEIEGEPTPKPTVEKSGGLLGYLNTTLQSAGRELGTVAKTAVDFAMNPSHAVEFGRDVVKGGATLAVGAAENIYEAATGQQPVQYNPDGTTTRPSQSIYDSPEGGTPSQQVARQFGQSAMNGVMNPLETFRDAPLSTLSVVAPGGAGLLNKASKASKLAGMAKTAKALSTSSKVVGALDPMNVTKLPAAAVKYAPKALTEYTGLTTGAGGGATKIAAGAKKADDTFFEGMRGDPLKQARQLQEDAQRGISVLRQRRAAQYQKTNEAMRSIMEPMDPKPIRTLLDDAMDDFRITKKEKDILDAMKNMDDAQSSQYLQSLMSSSDNPNALSPLVKAGLGEGPTAGKISKAINYVENWDDFTPDGLDRLQKTLSTLDAKPGSVEYAFINRVKKGVQQQVKDAYPEYTKMMSDYHEASDFLDEIQTAIGGKDVNGVEQAVRKMSQSMKTGNQGFEIRNAMLGELEQITGVQLRPRIAGMAMNQIAPRGLAGVAAGAAGPAAVWLGLVNPSFVLGLALSSPRVVGEVLGLIGVAKGKIPAIIQKLDRVVPPELRASMRGAVPEVVKQGKNAVRAGIITPDAE